MITAPDMEIKRNIQPKSANGFSTSPIKAPTVPIRLNGTRDFLKKDFKSIRKYFCKNKLYVRIMKDFYINKLYYENSFN